MSFIVQVPSSTSTNPVERSDCKRNTQKRRQHRHVTSQPRIRKKATRYPTGKVGTSGTPTQCMKLIKSLHKRRLKFMKHSVVLLFTSEAFYQNAKQELPDMI